MVWDKRGRKEKFLSLGLTLFVVLIVFFASSASAVKLNLKADKQVYRNDSRYVVFTSSIDINKDERVPITKLKIIVNKDFKVCEFDVSGNSNCPNIEIRPLFLVPLTQGEREANGFGSGNDEKPKNQQQDYGFGYGYGEVPHRQGLKGELLYEIRWDIISDNVSNGKYEVILEAMAGSGNNTFVYRSSAPSVFHVKMLPNEKGTVLESIYFDSYEGDIVKLDNYTNFSVENPSVSVDIRKVLDEGKTFVEGKISDTTYAETPDGKKVSLTFNFEDYKITTFNSTIIQLTGHAKYTFTANDARGKQIAKKTGEEIANIWIDINAGTARIWSTDKVPFDVHYTIN